jgi:signal transduction histidine kinase
MNSILGFASLLQDPALTRAEKREYIQIVREGSERLLNTIQDIIDISRIEARQMSLNLSDVNINEMVATLHSLYIREAENKFLDLRYPVLLPLDQGKIWTDKYKIYSILSNLINNAIKYTKTGYVEIVLERSPSTLRFNIRDTGIGIPLAKQDTIFDSFVQADASNTRLYEGSGLGLTITKTYVEMLGGKIWFESKENAGSSFFFEIPIQESESIDGSI